MTVIGVRLASKMIILLLQRYMVIIIMIQSLALHTAIAHLAVTQ